MYVVLSIRDIDAIVLHDYSSVIYKFIDVIVEERVWKVVVDGFVAIRFFLLKLTIEGKQMIMGKGDI